MLVCFRNQQRIAVLDWDAGEIVWAWGRGRISGPHDAQVLASGNILLFDNGLGRGWSRGVEMDPSTGDIVWEWRADPPEAFFTMSKGSIERLPNGNTLMAESDRGRAIEVTPAGEVVWEYECPYETGPGERAVIVRVRHFPHADDRRDGARSRPGPLGLDATYSSSASGSTDRRGRSRSPIAPLRSS